MKSREFLSQKLICSESVKLAYKTKQTLRNFSGNTKDRIESIEKSGIHEVT